MAITLQQRPSISASDVELVAIDYQSHLDTGETLTGTPTVVEVTTTDLTLGNKAVSSAVLTILGRSVPIAEAVQFSVTGQKAGTQYRIRVTVSTTSTPARTLVRDVVLECVS